MIGKYYILLVVYFGIAFQYIIRISVLSMAGISYEYPAPIKNKIILCSGWTISSKKDYTLGDCVMMLLWKI